MKRTLIFVAIVSLIVSSFLIYIFYISGNESFETLPSTKNESHEYPSDSNQDEIITNKNYIIDERVFKLETYNVHIDIRYPYLLYSENSNIDLGNINKILIPSELMQEIYRNMAEGLIKINDYGEFQFFPYDSYDYHYGIDYTYTIGLANDNLICLYTRSIAYIGTSHWEYWTVLINVQAGERILGKDFFDLQAFRECINQGCFKSNKDDFDILKHFESQSDIQLQNYLAHAFINSKKQIEVVVSYGDGDEIIMYTDLDNAKLMIKPTYLSYLDY